MQKPKLDHIVIVFPTAATQEDLLQFAEPFKKWFTLSEGGFHTDGKSQNVLIAFQDGVYLELIAFTSTPPTNHRWAQRTPIKLVDFACLGHPERVKEEYQKGMPGGRGKCKWVVTMPKDKWAAGTIPFWCEDVTPREIRVPKPERHPSGVTGLKRITILVDSTQERNKFVKTYRDLVGTENITIDTPSGGEVDIHVRVAETEEEREAVKRDGYGIYKVEFDVSGVTLCNPIFC